MLWDEIIKESSRFRLYLDYVVDQENVLMFTKKNVVVVKHALNKNPMHVTQNAVEFLSTLSEDQIKRMGIHEKVVVVSWARRVIGKYRTMETVQAKMDIINHRVKEVISLFNPLVNKGIPFFWEEKGPLLTQEKYLEKLVHRGSDHKKFEDMQHALSSSIQ